MRCVINDIDLLENFPTTKKCLQLSLEYEIVKYKRSILKTHAIVSRVCNGNFPLGKCYTHFSIGLATVKKRRSSKIFFNCSYSSTTQQPFTQATSMSSAIIQLLPTEVLIIFLKAEFIKCKIYTLFVP